MIGRVFVGAILLAALTGAGIWTAGYHTVTAQDGTAPEVARLAAPANAEEVLPAKQRTPARTSMGGNLYVMAQASVPAPPGFASERRGIAADPIVVANSRLAFVLTQEVPSQR